MNIITALSSLASNSAHDPEPSIWSRETVREMEERFFAGQDDYGEWTPAFVRSIAQWLDVKGRQRSAAIGLLTRERDELRDTLRDLLESGRGGLLVSPEWRRAFKLVYGAEPRSITRENADPLPDPVLDAKLAAVRGEMGRPDDAA